jgi:CRP-like cAMP-binding protein
MNDLSKRSGSGADAAATDGDEARSTLARARALQASGDIAAAVGCYRRAVEQLMESGDDEAALDVARLAASLSSSQPPARVITAAQTAARAAAPSVPPPSGAGFSGPHRVITRPSQVPATIALLPGGRERELPVPADAAASGEVSGEDAIDVLRALRQAVSFQPGRADQAEVLSDCLSEHPLFGELPAETVRAVARQATLVEFEPGEPIVTPGGSGQEAPLFVVLEGRGLLRAPGDEGPGTPIGAGDFVGETTAVYGGRSVTSATAREFMSAAALPRSLVSWLAREFPGVRATLEDLAWERAFAAVGRASPFLRRLAPDQRGVVFARFEPVVLQPGDLLLGEGAPPLAFWLIAAGEVEVYGGGISGRVPLRAQAGDAIGLRAIVAGEPSGVSARAVGPALAAKVGVSAFRALLEKHGALAEAADDIGIPGRAIVC